MMDYEKMFSLNVKRIEYNSIDDFLNFEYLDYEFIKYYRVIDNKLIIYSSNKIITIPYDKSIEEKLLNKMKNQINTWKEKLEKKSLSMFAIIYLANSFNYYLKSFFESHLFYFVTGSIWLLGGVIYSIPKITNSIELSDIKKHLLFLENEEKINKNLKDKMFELNVVDKESLNLVPLFSSYVTINDIHFMNINEVKKLINSNITEEQIYKLKKTEI